MDIIFVIGWIFITFTVVSVGAFFARKQQPEILVGIFAACMMMVPAFGGKPTIFGPFIVNAPIIVFSATFLLTDMLSEFFGKQYARRAVLAGFIASILWVVTTQVAIHWTPADFWENQEAFETVFGSSWRIVLGSFFAYLVAQYHYVWAFHFWKGVFKGKYLWLRNNLSTGVSQVLDSAVFLIIAFYGVLPIWPMFISFVVLKFIITLIDTPFLYAVRWYYNKGEVARQKLGG